MGYKFNISVHQNVFKDWFICKSRGANRNHILTKQSTKRKRHNRGLNKLNGVVLKWFKLINK